MEQLINLKETELCLGLPGGPDPVETPTKSCLRNKRGFSEIVELKLGLHSTKEGSVDLNVAGAPKKKTLHKDPSKPPAKLVSIYTIPINKTDFPDSYIYILETTLYIYIYVFTKKKNYTYMRIFMDL